MKNLFGLAVFLFLTSAILAVDVFPTEDQISCLADYASENAANDDVMTLLSDCDTSRENVSF